LPKRQERHKLISYNKVAVSMEAKPVREVSHFLV
jgi:hypothetical protein